MITVRALTDGELEAFRRARLVSGELMPYFMRALFAVTPLGAPGLGTFAVDGRWRLYMDPELLVGAEAWSSPTAGAVLLHEVSHLIRAHAVRANSVSPQPISDIAWNYAADAEINDDLLAAGVGLPEGVITPQDLECEAGDIAERYYEAIRPQHQPDDETEKPPVEFGDEPGCGSGAGGRVPAWELGAGENTVAGIDAAAGDMVRRLVARDVKSAAAKGRGSVPGGLDRWADHVLAPPQVPWTQVLCSQLRRVIGNKAGLTFHSYARPSRRKVAGAVLPAMRTSTVGVAIVTDTSGSMSQEDLDAAMSEIDGVLRSTAVDRDRVTVLACDAASTEPQRVSSVSAVRLVGGGGTDMRVGISAAMRSRPAPNVVVVLTDGLTPWPEEPLARTVLVIVVIGQPNADTPEWAITVHIPTGAAASLAGTGAR